MAFQFSITTGAGVPIYRQLVDQLRAAIASEQVGEGYQLPSIRTLAERIVVNPNTIAKAYNEMVRDGLVDTLPGKGFFVAPRRQRLSLQEQERCLDSAVESFVHEVLLLEFTRAEILSRVDNRLISLEPAER
jgi:GntR family transcriptional regulator